MKISKLCVVPLCVVAALFVAATCYGQAPQIMFVGSGDSAGDGPAQRRVATG
jgi:hypothetical protein